jgi:hypothetical protein
MHGLAALAANFPARERRIPMPTINPSEVGALIRGARKVQGLRHEELHGITEVGLGFIVELEWGKATVQLARVTRVPETLGCGITITPHPV